MIVPSSRKNCGDRGDESQRDFMDWVRSSCIDLCSSVKLESGIRPRRFDMSVLESRIQRSDLDQPSTDVDTLPNFGVLLCKDWCRGYHRTKYRRPGAESRDNEAASEPTPPPHYISRMSGLTQRCSAAEKCFRISVSLRTSPFSGTCSWRLGSIVCEESRSEASRRQQHLLALQPGSTERGPGASQSGTRFAKSKWVFPGPPIGAPDFAVRGLTLSPYMQADAVHKSTVFSPTLHSP